MHMAEVCVYIGQGGCVYTGQGGCVYTGQGGCVYTGQGGCVYTGQGGCVYMATVEPPNIGIIHCIFSTIERLSLDVRVVPYTVYIVVMTPYQLISPFRLRTLLDRGS